MNGLHVLNVPGMNTAKETKSVRQLAPLRNATQKTTVFAIGNQDVASLIMTVKVIHTHTTANVFICQDMEVEHVLEQKLLMNNFNRFTFTYPDFKIYISDELSHF